MNNCRHVNKLSPAVDHSVLNRQKWICAVCSSSENILACLSCSHVACGNFLDHHMSDHFRETKHALAIEVFEKYVFCYECDDYILNDNSAGDIKILRSCLETQSNEVILSPIDDASCRRSSRIRRSCSTAALTQALTRFDLLAAEEDLTHVDLWFRRYYILASAFSRWKAKSTVLSNSQPDSNGSVSDLNGVQTNGHLPATNTRPLRRRSSAISGVTGLRNLGNTCYMNSILQVLRHVYQFSKVFANDRHPVNVLSPGESSSNGASHHQQPMPQSPAPISNGCSPSSSSQHDAVMANGKKKLNGRKSEDSMQQKSLLHELHSLLRVMWSGRMSMVVSPHNMLCAVWNIIPFFRGYSQQDAQEFLSEFLDKVQCEIDRQQPSVSNGIKCHGGVGVSSPKDGGDDVITLLFQGELVSQVTCLACSTKSEMREPFMDLSLDFPSRYHCRGPAMQSWNDPCNIEEMLAKFTEVEKLDGQIYACDHCNKNRRKVSSKPPLHTEAQKCFLVAKLPNILRLHLKRFMWSGRNHRGKIPVHVDFADELDVRSYCHPDLMADNYMYKLSAVVMHHGRGFGSGHYTAYCWNDEAGSWLHCNDAKMRMVSIDEVYKAQAYILIYVRSAVALSFNQSKSVMNDETASLITSSIARFSESSKRSADGNRLSVKRRKTTIW